MASPSRKVPMPMARYPKCWTINSKFIINPFTLSFPLWCSEVPVCNQFAHPEFQKAYASGEK